MRLILPPHYLVTVVDVPLVVDALIGIILVGWQTGNGYGISVIGMTTMSNVGATVNTVTISNFLMVLHVTVLCIIGLLILFIILRWVLLMVLFLFVIYARVLERRRKSDTKTTNRLIPYLQL